MKDKKDLLAYCGLYCGDCGGFSGEIAYEAIKLKASLEKFKFQRTAQGIFPKKLKEYNKFLSTLEFLTTLKCSALCRHVDTSKSKCKIRNCCRAKGYFACYECPNFEKCEILNSQSEIFGNSYIKNFRAIKKDGLENWLNSGKRYWFHDD